MSDPLIPLRFDAPRDDDHAADVSRIVEIFFHRGYRVSPSDVRAVWQHYSDTMAAGWMDLGDDDYALFNLVFDYLTIDPEL